jgi:hypothetical protein
MKQLQIFALATALTLALCSPAFAKGGTISATAAGTISATKAGTISATKTGTISATQSGTISATRSGTISATKRTNLYSFGLFDLFMALLLP